MKKNTVRWWGVLTILLIVYSVLAFAIPFKKNAVFIISYLFTLVAMGTQIYVIRAAFYQGKGVKSKFYGFPIAKVGAIYLIVQVVLSFVFMTFGAIIPVWIPLILYVVMLGTAALGFIAADVARNEVVQQDVKLKKDLSTMRTLQAKVGAIADQCDVVELKKLAENLRYSDPVSGEATAEIEKELATYIEALQKAIIDNDNASISSLCQKAESKLMERNSLCKLNKH